MFKIIMIKKDCRVCFGAKPVKIKKIAALSAQKECRLFVSLIPFIVIPCLTRDLPVKNYYDPANIYEIPGRRPG